jgi:hypothetical protein
MARHAEKSRLARGVRQPAVGALRTAGERGHVDHRAATARGHARHQRTAPEEGAVQVDANHQVPARVIDSLDTFETRGVPRTGDVRQDIGGTEITLDRTGDRVDLRTLRDVALVGARRAPAQ